jgi:hypothetical protein
MRRHRSAEESISKGTMAEGDEGNALGCGKSRGGVVTMANVTFGTAGPTVLATCTREYRSGTRGRELDRRRATATVTATVVDGRGTATAVTIAGRSKRAADQCRPLPQNGVPRCNMPVELTTSDVAVAENGLPLRALPRVCDARRGVVRDQVKRRPR